MTLCKTTSRYGAGRGEEAVAGAAGGIRTPSLVIRSKEVVVDRVA